MRDRPLRMQPIGARAALAAAAIILPCSLALAKGSGLPTLHVEIVPLLPPAGNGIVGIPFPAPHDACESAEPLHAHLRRCRQPLFLPRVPADARRGSDGARHPCPRG